VKFYNESAPKECPPVKSLSEKRRLKAKKYLRAFPQQPWWQETFANLTRSRFLRGLKNNPGHESFVADFDWLLSVGKDGTENCVKVHDGKYTDPKD